jgi:YD repeat-containing protein
MIKEEWRLIPDYPNYMISNLGRVKSLDYGRTGKERILKLGYNGEGYLKVELWNEKGKTQFAVHKLVALVFIPNPDNLPEVNHKDENKENNCVDNLEWCTKSYNINYGNRNKKVAEKLYKKLGQYDLSGNLIAVYDSVKEAEAEGYKESEISRCCHGKRPKYKDSFWKYL